MMLNESSIEKPYETLALLSLGLYKFKKRQLLGSLTHPTAMLLTRLGGMTSGLVVRTPFTHAVPMVPFTHAHGPGF